MAIHDVRFLIVSAIRSMLIHASQLSIAKLYGTPCRALSEGDEAGGCGLAVLKHAAYTYYGGSLQAGGCGLIVLERAVWRC